MLKDLLRSALATAANEKVGWTRLRAAYAIGVEGRTIEHWSLPSEPDRVISGDGLLALMLTRGALPEAAREHLVRTVVERAGFALVRPEDVDADRSPIVAQVLECAGAGGKVAELMALHAAAGSDGGSSVTREEARESLPAARQYLQEVTECVRTLELTAEGRS